MIRIKYEYQADEDQWELEDGFNSFPTYNNTSHIYKEEPDVNEMLNDFKQFLLGVGYSPEITKRIRLLDIDQLAKFQLTE